jgi:hypothetical protein
VTIERVVSRPQLARFITLPRRLYAGMPGYVAPLDHERYQLLDPRKSPFFTHGYASYWIASRDGREVGRISAQIDHAAEGPDAADIGLFGCLDAIDDGEVVGELLRTAEDWLRRQGRRIARGPFLLSINGESGLLLEGHTLPAITLMPWHPPYLAERLQGAGYASAMRLFGFDLEFDAAAADPRVHQLAELRSRLGITLRNLRAGAMAEDMELARRMFNDGWRDNWGFTPFTETDLRALLTQFRPVLYPDAGFFVDVAGEPAAFMLSIPNLFELTGDLGARPGLTGWAKIAFRIWRERYRAFRIVFLGMTAKHQRSFIGGAILAIAFDEIRRRSEKFGIREGHAGWVLESNRALVKAADRFIGPPTRTYGIYQKYLVD